MKHLIRKQVIMLQLDAGQDAFAVQRQSSDYYYQCIAPALEKLFDELSSENEITHIDRFEVDLGDLGWKDNCFTLGADAVYQIVKKTLAKTLSQSGSESSPSVFVRHRTREENACMHWLHYMEKGVLPWEIVTFDEKWPEHVLHQLAIDHVMISKTRALITANPWFLARLVREHREEFLQKLVEIITARRHPDLVEMVSELTKQFDADSVEKQIKTQQIWKSVLTQYAAGKVEINMADIAPQKSRTPAVSAIPYHQEITQEGLFCQYAGLVLLHVFFTQLFNRLHLLDNGDFRDIDCRGKAIVLLYFIAAGKTAATDHELVVPKVLCGMRPEETVSDESFFLTDAEKEEGLNMMHAAIEQWEIIHNTSPEGLREGFLVRNGKLQYGENGITFRIESKSIDMLLDQLPWNLSLIKLPWLEKLIRVDWR